MRAGTSIWHRYEQVLRTSGKVPSALWEAAITAWSEAWFMPDEVAAWLARGILSPIEASGLRASGLRPQDVAAHKQEESQTACQGRQEGSDVER